jgi:hypothetical protein
MYDFFLYIEYLLEVLKERLNFSDIFEETSKRVSMYKKVEETFKNATETITYDGKIISNTQFPVSRSLWKYIIKYWDEKKSYVDYVRINGVRDRSMQLVKKLYEFDPDGKNLLRKIY